MTYSVYGCLSLYVRQLVQVVVLSPTDCWDRDNFPSKKLQIELSVKLDPVYLFYKDQNWVVQVNNVMSHPDTMHQTVVGCLCLTCWLATLNYIRLCVCVCVQYVVYIQAYLKERCCSHTHTQKNWKKNQILTSSHVCFTSSLFLWLVSSCYLYSAWLPAWLKPEGIGVCVSIKNMTGTDATVMIFKMLKSLNSLSWVKFVLIL